MRCATTRTTPKATAATVPALTGSSTCEGVVRVGNGEPSSARASCELPPVVRS